MWLRLSHWIQEQGELFKVAHGCSRVTAATSVNCVTLLRSAGYAAKLINSCVRRCIARESPTGYSYKFSQSTENSCCGFGKTIGIQLAVVTFKQAYSLSLTGTPTNPNSPDYNCRPAESAAVLDPEGAKFLRAAKPCRRSSSALSCCELPAATQPSSSSTGFFPSHFSW